MPSKVYKGTKGMSRWEANSDNIDIDYRTLDGQKRCAARCFMGRKGLVLQVLVVVVIFAVGLIIGYILRRNVHEKFLSHKDECQNDIKVDDLEKVGRELRDKLNFPASYKDSLQLIVKDVQFAATARTVELTNYVQKIWKINGIHSVKKKEYRVTLSYPDMINPSEITVNSTDGTELFHSEDANATNEHPEYRPFNAYSPSITAEGQLVHGNYGRHEDFVHLKELNLTVAGKLVLIRYGKIYPGSKVKHAEDNGAIGVILYPDPYDYANNQNATLPGTWWLPPWAEQSYHVRSRLHGDPRTPDYAAVDGIPIVPDDTDSFPKIPVHTISGQDAVKLVKSLNPSVTLMSSGGLDVSDDSWPHLAKPQADKVVRLSVRNNLTQRPITNLIGVIHGRYEKDKYVIIGAHHDAYTTGAVEIGTGFAILLELVTAYTNQLKTGWKPRRTIIFALWDASKFGSIGAYEWVQEYEKELSAGAVAYINLDSVVRGNYSFYAEASPMLAGLIRLAARKVPCPDPDHPDKTVLDMWTQKFPDKTRNLFSSVPPPGGEGDHSPFLYLLGIPTLSPAYTYNMKKYPNLPTYPTYNTLEDTLHYVTTFIDPDYKLHFTVAQIVCEVILQLADSPILPLDVHNYVTTFITGHSLLKQHKSELPPSSLENINSTMWKFVSSTVYFYNQVQDLMKRGNASDFEYYQVNDKILQLSRAFILDKGIPGQPHYRNALLAPHPEDLSRVLYFPGIMTALMRQRDSDATTSDVQEQVTRLILCLREAAALLTGEMITEFN